MSASRRTFLKTIGAVGIATALPFPIKAHPKTVTQQNVLGSFIQSFPVNTQFHSCLIEVDEELPPGYHYTNCKFEWGSDYMGECMIRFRPNVPATTVQGCVLHAENAPRDRVIVIEEGGCENGDGLFVGNALYPPKSSFGIVQKVKWRDWQKNPDSPSEELA